MKTELTAENGKLRVVVTPETEGDEMQMRSLLCKLGLHPDEWEDTDECADINAEFRFRTRMPED